MRFIKKIPLRFIKSEFFNTKRLTDAHILNRSTFTSGYFLIAVRIFFERLFYPKVKNTRTPQKMCGSKSGRLQMLDRF